ncbi:MAG: MlaD family protein, partial [Desulfobulbaceae bacterium]|nr:MlaD family protein [Desulfobulbaceae bacterium]
FYHLPGLSVSASITGVEIEMDSLRSLVNGGIGVITPDNTNHNISDNKQFSLYSGLQEAQAEDALKITLSSEEVDAITEKMKIKYHGITIGKIIKADFAPGFHHTIGQAVVREDSRHLFRENTLIHLVKPRLGITAIENPETLVSGPYLEIIPGKGKIKTNFTISLSSTPHLSDQGLHITLVAPRLGHLRPSSPVYYRQVQIGEVTGYSLAPQGQSVLIELYIPKKFAEIIHSGSKFWLTSGIQITGGLFSEFQVSAESMESLLKGGVGVATPDDKHMGRSAINKDTFPLNPQVDPKWLNWSPSLPLTY